MSKEREEGWITPHRKRARRDANRDGNLDEEKSQFLNPNSVPCVKEKEEDYSCKEDEIISIEKCENMRHEREEIKSWNAENITQETLDWLIKTIYKK